MEMSALLSEWQVPCRAILGTELEPMRGPEAHTQENRDSLENHVTVTTDITVPVRQQVRVAEGWKRSISLHHPQCQPPTPPGP